MTEKDGSDQSALHMLELLAGGGLRADRLAEDLASDHRMIAELLCLWEFPGELQPTGTAFDPGAEDYGDHAG